MTNREKVIFWTDHIRSTRSTTADIDTACAALELIGMALDQAEKRLTDSVEKLEPCGKCGRNRVMR